MYKVTKTIDFCYGHRLINYEGKCANLHGHNGRVEIDLGTEVLDARGMVVDFGDIKSIVKDWIDTSLDHKMLLCDKDPLLPILRDAGQKCFVMLENPTAENIARIIFDAAMVRMLPVVEVRLWEQPDAFATYRRDVDA